MVRYFIVLLVGFCPFFQLSAQTYQFGFGNAPTVRVGGNALPNAFAGGLNAPQFSQTDLNRDGKPDLVVFDRTSNRITTFLVVDNQWQYAPAYEGIFPPATFWMLLKDYNGDGLADFFTGSIDGIAAYRQVIENDRVSFRLAKDPLLTKGLSGANINLKIDVTDLPALADFDRDGDMDIVNFVPSVGFTLEFNKNLSQELYGRPDSLVFEKTTNTWGNFTECSTCGDFIFGSIGSCRTEQIEHAGSTVMPVDWDNDQDWDLLMGDVDCRQLSYLENKGTPAQEVFSESVDFPFANPVDIQSFPAAFYLDVTFDNRPDLLVAPNLFFNEGDLSDFGASAWLYVNDAATGAPVFRKERENFLQHTMLELGESVSPAVADLDGDGDADLLLANRGRRQAGGDFVGKIAYFDNTGTASAPVFELVTDDWLQFSTLGNIELKIGFADLNRDGRPDLHITSRPNGQRDPVFRYFPDQQAAPGFQATLSNAVTLPLDLSPQDQPLFADLDADNDPDLLIGRFRGGVLDWYENTGNLSFTLKKSGVGGLTFDNTRRELSLALADLLGDGQPDLILGDRSGELRIVSNLIGQLNNEAFTFAPLLFERPNGLSPASRTFGGGLFPAALGRNLVVGTLTGGVLFFHNQTTISSLPTESPRIPEVVAYPSPTQGEVWVSANQPARVTVVNAWGQVVTPEQAALPGQPLLLSLTNLPAGWYGVLIRTADRQILKKIIKL